MFVGGKSIFWCDQCHVLVDADGTERKCDNCDQPMEVIGLLEYEKAPEE